MNAFQICRNTSDAIPLYLPQQLYLKPCASICISVQLSKTTGTTIIHGEIIQKLKKLIVPDEFAGIKVTRSAVDVVRFEAELDLEAYVQRVLHKLDNKFIKLKDITQLLKVKACVNKTDCPSKHEWDSYFRDAKDMNEMKFGERPDTIHISNLPTRWFLHKNDQDHADYQNKQVAPSEKLFYYTFEKFGDIRNVDIPICDPYRSKMKAHITGIQTSSFDDTQFFEGYVQFKEYIGFVECMNALRGMKLMRKSRLGDTESIKIFVTFDKSKHLSEGSIRRRDILRERLVLKAKSKEDIEREKQEEIQRKLAAEIQRTEKIRLDKQQRRMQREEKRKAKFLEQLKGRESSDFNEKIAQEERKLLVVQRRLEAIRLVENLFKRISDKLNLTERTLSSKGPQSQLKHLKDDYELEFNTQRDNLSKAIGGRVMLRSIVSSTTKEVCAEEEVTTSSEDSIGNTKRDEEKIYPSHPINPWYSYWQNPLMAAASAAYGAVPPPFYDGYYQGHYLQRGRGGNRPGPSGGRPFRGHYRGGRGFRPYNNRTSRFNSERHSRSRSMSRDRSRSRSHSRSGYSRSRSRSRSKSRSRRRRSSTRSRTRSRSLSSGKKSRSKS